MGVWAEATPRHPSVGVTPSADAGRLGSRGEVTPRTAACTAVPSTVMGTRGAVTKHAAHDQARALFEQRAWGEAYEAFARCRQLEASSLPTTSNGWRSPPTSPGTMTRRATRWARAHRAYLRVDDGLAAVRCAFWLGCVLILSGQLAPAHGWFARTQHLARQAPARTGREPGTSTWPPGSRRCSPAIRSLLTRASRPRRAPVLRHARTRSRRTRPARVRAGARS